MKKTKILSLLLSLALLVGVVNPGVLATEAHADDQSTGSSSSGMEISKTATANEDGTYTITLEAYATGSKVISTEKKDIPTDIVLVLDQSGSMSRCIVCGHEISSGWGGSSTHNKYTYTEATSVSNENTYYVKNGSTYTAVSYCSGTHYDGWGGYTECTGGAGWYTSDRAGSHTSENKYVPNTEDSVNGVQFYTRSSDGTEPCTSRKSALETAVTNFINSVAEKSKGADGQYGSGDDVDHRIAVVGFASTVGWYAYNNTELLSTSSVINYANASSSDYKEALVSALGTDGDVNSSLTAAVSRLDADGDTYLQYGMDMANKIFEQNPIAKEDTSGRQRVVIVFTDGYPAPSGSNDFDYNMADRAIDYAYETKNAYNSTVYTVAVLDGADPTANIEDGYSYGGRSDEQQKIASNRYLHFVSSNYLTATSMKNGGPLNPKANPFGDGDSYYLSAGDADTLNSIFQQISQNIESGGSSTTLSKETVIKDIISDQFELPADTTANDITLETWACTGKSENGYTWVKNEGAMGAAATVSDGQVSVTGFDFAENYVGTVTVNGNVTYRGNKLVIKFKVKPKDGFLGGNDVYTNTSAGVYENSSATDPVLTFERPQVNVAIKNVTVTAADKNVYLLSNLTADQIKDGATVKCGNVALNLSKADQNYGLKAWQTEYVDITVTVKDKDGNVISDKLDNLTDDTTYTVEVTVEPKTVGTSTTAKGDAATAKTGVNDPAANIYVFKPELKFMDSSAYYGETIPTNNNYSSNRVGTEKWMHDSTEAVPGEMLGTKPTLNISFTPDESKLENGKYTKQDVPVTATVEIGTKNVNDYTTFVHQDCTTACGWATPAKPGAPAFLIHIQTCTLNITKQGGAVDESYVFDVFKDGEKYTEISVWGNDSVTIFELPIGSYTIQENEGWSWRYTADNSSAANLTAQNPTGSITCNNTKAENYWLNGFSTIVKNIFGVANNEGRD